MHWPERLHAASGLLDAVDEQRAVRQAGQRVVGRLLGEGGLGVLQLGHALGLGLAEPGDLAILGLLGAEVGEGQAGAASSPSTSRGELPTSTGTRPPLASSRSSSRCAEPAGPQLGRRSAPGRETRQRRPDDRLRRARQQLGEAAVGVEDEPGRRERRGAVAHVLDEHPVRPVGGREREHPPGVLAVGDDERVDLARADGPQRVLRLGHPGQRVAASRVGTGAAWRGQVPTHSASPSSTTATRVGRRERSPTNLRTGSGRCLTRVGTAWTPLLQRGVGILVDVDHGEAVAAAQMDVAQVPGVGDRARREVGGAADEERQLVGASRLGHRARRRLDAQPDEHALGVREVADDLAQRRRQAADERRDGEDVVAAGQRRMLDRGR